MTHSSAIDVPPSILPCMFFKAALEDTFFVEAPDEWHDSEAVRLLGLATDLVAAEAMAGRMNLEIGHSAETDRAKIILYFERSTGQWRWHIKLIGCARPGRRDWLTTYSRHFSTEIYERLSFILERAAGYAEILPTPHSDNTILSLQYATRWDEISNHVRLELEARSRLSLNDLLNIQTEVP
jgi:hypothetical protein